MKPTIKNECDTCMSLPPRPGETKLCAECPIRANDEWRARWAIVRNAVAERDFTFLELKLLHFLLDKTYGWNRAEVVIPSLDFFVQILGIAKEQATRTIQSLHGNRVIYCRKKDGLRWYSINDNFTAWGVRIQIFSSGAAKLNDLRELNGLPPARKEEDAALNFNHRPAQLLFSTLIDKKTIAQSTAVSTDDIVDWD